MNRDERVMTMLADLNAQRHELEVLTAQKAAAYEAWRTDNLALLANVDNTEAEVKRLEAEIRQEAVRTYQMFDNPHPYPGVEVKVFTVLTYEEREALQWAVTHGIALTLNKRLFEDIAKGPTGAEMPFVKISKEARAQLAKDLSKALELEGKP